MEWTAGQEATLVVGALALFALVAIVASGVARNIFKRWE